MTKRIRRRVAAAHSALSVEYPVPTIIEFVLDETGSMDQAATIGGYNDFLREQRGQPGVCLLTLTKFDTRGLRTPYTDIEIGLVPDLTLATYVPGEWTNLYDAIVWRAAVLKTRLAKWDIRPNVLFVVMTDGDDNASRNTVEQARDCVLNGNTLGWTCVYLGPPRSAATGLKLGFPEGNIKTFEARETRQTMQALSAATTAFRAAAATTTSFFGAQTAAC